VQIEFVGADWQARQHVGATATLRGALAKATRLAREASSYPDAQQTLAEAHLRLARAESANRAAIDAHIRSGLAALDRVFLVNPRHGRSRATQGDLLLLQAEHARDEAARRKAAKSAVTALEQAIASDPVLTRTVTPLLSRARAIATQ